jgi:hypothetical protein
MTSIYDIPYEDIQEFLLANKKTYINEIDAYNKALILLKDKKSVGHTISIIEWMIAYNLLKKKVNIPNFTIYQIDNMKQFEIDELAKLLTMNGNNRENIKNILKYLNKLDFLPEHLDIKPQILNTILELKVLSSGLRELIDIFEQNKFLRKFIYDNMEQIIINNMTIRKFGVITNYDADYLAKFIFNFMKMNEFTLAKRAIEIAKKYEYLKNEGSKVIKYLTYHILISLDADLIIKYFDIFNYINSVYKNENWKSVIDDYAIKYALINPTGELDYSQKKFLPSIFEAALKTEKKLILDIIYQFYWFEADHGTKKKSIFVKQMEPLIKEYETKYKIYNH